MKKLILVIGLISMICTFYVSSYPSDTNQVITAPEVKTGKKEGLKTFALGLSTTDFILGIALAKVPVTYLMAEISMNEYLAIQLDFGIAISSYFSALQGGGGIRYYFKGEGLRYFWLGAYFDGFLGNSNDGIETGILIGYKYAGKDFFIDPFVGIRVISVDPNRAFEDPVTIGLRYGLNIGFLL